MKEKIKKSRLMEIIKEEITNSVEEGILSFPSSNKPMLGLNEQPDPLKLEKLNRFFQEAGTLEEKQNLLFKSLKQERLNLAEFRSLLKNLEPDESGYKA